MANVIGIEIAEQSIRAVEISRGRRPMLVAAGEVPLPEGAAKDSEILDPDAVSLALRQLWSQAGLRGNRVHLGISNRRILVREYVSPRLAPELLKAALPYEVQDLLPVPVEQAVLDFYAVSETDTHIFGLLVAAVAETVEGLINTLANARLRTDAVDFLPFGLARLVRSLGGHGGGEAVAIASVGEHTTNFVVTVDGIPRFVRIIPVDLAADLFAPAGLVPAAASPDGWVARRAFAEVGPVETGADPSLTDLVGRLRSTLRFYAGREGAEPISRMYLTGAGLTAPGLAAAVASGLDVPVTELGMHDLIAFSKSISAIGTPPPSLVNALGIALGDDK